MRIGYSDDEERPGQFALWQANCDRSLKGKAGQRELRELEAALLALPKKRLIKDLLCEGDDVCAVGAYAKYKGLDLDRFDPEDESDEVGVSAGMPSLVAWKVVEMNDLQLDTVWELAYGPVNRYEAHYRGGIPLIRDMTPEERYENMLAWVRKELKPCKPKVAEGAPEPQP